MPSSRSPWRVVILGGGFGGLYAANYLARSFDLEPHDEVLLIDAKNFFTFSPLLSEVAAGTLGREHVAVPFRRLAAKNGFRFIQAEVDGLDPDACVVETSAGRFDYDQCILALGSGPQFFGNAELAQHSFPLKSLADALALRDRIIGISEAAAAETDESTRRELLTFVVAGAGPAGVETAAEIHHLFKRVLPDYYPGADHARVVLVHSGEQILGGFDPELAAEGSRNLSEAGLELRLATRLTGACDRWIDLSDGDRIPTRTLIWTAGARPNALGLEAGLEVDKSGAVIADDRLRVDGYDNLFVVGDMCALSNPRTDNGYPRVAPIALSQGVRAAANVENARAGRPAEAYAAHHAGKIVSVGAGRALVDILGLKVKGRTAWYLYRTTYVLKLVGLRNKLQVVFTLALNAVLGRDLSTELDARALGRDRPSDDPAAGDVRLQELV